MKKTRNSFLIIIVILISCVCTLSAYAASGEKMGTIEINAERNMKFEYSQIGDIVDGEYVLREEYKKSGVNLKHLKYAEEAERAAKKLNLYMKPEHTIITGQDGKARIENLPQGIYLIRYLKEPVLVTVPVWDEKMQDFIYDITVIPKLEENPKTGDDPKPGMYFTFIMMLAVAGGLVSYMNKKCK